VQKINFRPVEISDLYYKNVDMTEKLSMDIIPEVIKEVKKLQEKYTFYREDPFYRGIIPYLENPNKRLFTCYAGFTSCYIDPYWNVYPCIYLNFPMGNLRENDFSLRKIWYSDRSQRIRDWINEKKCSCWTRCQLDPSLRSNPIELIRSGLKRRFHIP
jgi:radical SAM protein with 4Fe4S-binding SPASM domain